MDFTFRLAKKRRKQHRIVPESWKIEEKINRCRDQLVIQPRGRGWRGGVVAQAHVDWIYLEPSSRDGNKDSKPKKLQSRLVWIWIWASVWVRVRVRVRGALYIQIFCDTKRLFFVCGLLRMQLLLLLLGVSVGLTAYLFWLLSVANLCPFFHLGVFECHALIFYTLTGKWYPPNWFFL